MRTAAAMLTLAAAVLLDAAHARKRNMTSHTKDFAAVEVDGATTILTSDRILEVNVAVFADEVSPSLLSDYMPILVDRAEHAADRQQRALDWGTLGFHVGPRDRDGMALLIVRVSFL